VNPAQTDASGFARVVKSFLAGQIRRKDIDGLSGRILCRDARATRPEQVLEPDRHIRCGRVEAGASGSGLGGDAGSVIMGADQQMFALLSVRKERRVPHLKRVESTLGKKSRILLVCSRMESIAEEIERHIRVERRGTGSAAETLVWQPAPAGAVVGEGEVRRIARSVSQFPRETRCVCRYVGERDWADAFRTVLSATSLVRTSVVKIFVSEQSRNRESWVGS
jgi:hypothetical protein